MSDKVQFINSNNSLRLDKFLVEELTRSGRQDLSRTNIQELISAGEVMVDGCIVTKSNYIVEPGATVTLNVLDREDTGIVPQEMPIDIMYEDDVMLVINKPSGLIVHPGAGHRHSTLANALAARGGEATTLPRAGLVHRLDKETSGVLVIAKTAKSYMQLVRSFAERSVYKEYIAVVLSTPRHDRLVAKNESGTLTFPIGRDPKHPTKMTVSEKGRPAITHWEIIERMSYAVYVKIKIETGRTHQIRVHMSHVGSPVIGDKVYGDFSLLPKSLRVAAMSFRHALHAHTIKFLHPESGVEVQFEAPIPRDFSEVLDEFRRVR